MNKEKLIQKEPVQKNKQRRKKARSLTASKKISKILVSDLDTLDQVNNESSFPKGSIEDSFESGCLLKVEKEVLEIDSLKLANSER